MFTIAELSETTGISDFTERPTVASTTTTSEESFVKNFSITSTTVDVTHTTTYVPEISSSTIESNERVNSCPKENYVIKCFERVCTTTPLNSLGKCFL